MRTCGLMLSFIPFGWKLFLNVSIWKLNCYKWESNHWKDKGKLCNLFFFLDFWYQHRQVVIAVVIAVSVLNWAWCYKSTPSQFEL